MIPLLIFHDDSQSPTKQILSSNSRLFLPKQSVPFDIPAHLKPIAAISQHMLGLRKRVSEDGPVRFMRCPLDAQQVFPVLGQAT